MPCNIVVVGLLIGVGTHRGGAGLCVPEHYIVLCAAQCALQCAAQCAVQCSVQCSAQCAAQPAMQCAA